MKLRVYVCISAFGCTYVCVCVWTCLLQVLHLSDVDRVKRGLNTRSPCSKDWNHDPVGMYHLSTEAHLRISVEQRSARSEKAEFEKQLSPQLCHEGVRFSVTEERKVKSPKTRCFYFVEKTAKQTLWPHNILAFQQLVCLCACVCVCMNVRP